MAFLLCHVLCPMVQILFVKYCSKQHSLCIFLMKFLNFPHFFNTVKWIFKWNIPTLLLKKETVFMKSHWHEGTVRFLHKKKTTHTQSTTNRKIRRGKKTQATNNKNQTKIVRKKN